MNTTTFYSEIPPTKKKFGVAFDTGEALKSVTKFQKEIATQEETYRLQRRRTLTFNDVREKNSSLFEEFSPAISTHLLQQGANWDE